MNVKLLKDKILQLAIQGKLVPQNENDEPASVLIEKIKVKKEKLIKEKIIKKEKPLSPITDEEKDFELPKGWEWVRLGIITICKDGERIPVSTKDRENREKIYDYYGASGIIDKIDNYLFDKPLLLIGEDGANLISRSTPIAFIAKGKYWVNNHAHVIDSIDLIVLRYLEIYVNSIDLEPHITGTAQPKLNQANLNKILISLPPLEEQKRIVEKVDKLFCLIDELENNQQDLLQNISSTRNKVLSLAIQGKLVPQNENDEPASVLIEKIKDEKERLIKEKIIKKEKTLPSITEEEKDFDLPKGWEWCHFEDTIILATDYVANGSFKSLRDNVNTYKDKNFALLLKTQDFSNNFTQNLTYIDEKSYEFLSKTKLFGGELILSNVGSIGKAFIVPYMEVPMSLAPNSIMIKCIDKTTTLYIKIIILSYYGQNYLKELTSGTTIAKFNKTQLRQMIIPLPPLEEQKRIVKKVDTIMSYLDTIEKQIKKVDNFGLST